MRTHSLYLYLTLILNTQENSALIKRLPAQQKKIKDSADIQLRPARHIGSSHEVLG